MKGSDEFTQSQHGLEQFLGDVRQRMIGELRATPLGQMIEDFGSLLGSGKMLRSRMAYRLEPTSGVPREELVAACAAVEMIHAASLLHDDVIDPAETRPQLIRALEMLQNKRDSLPAKKHGNIPL